MSERCKQMSKRRSEWPSTLCVDFVVILPTVLCSEYCLGAIFSAQCASSRLSAQPLTTPLESQSISLFAFESRKTPTLNVSARPFLTTPISFLGAFTLHQPGCSQPHQFSPRVRSHVCLHFIAYWGAFACLFLLRWVLRGHLGVCYHFI